MSTTLLLFLAAPALLLAMATRRPRAVALRARRDVRRGPG